VQTSLGGTVANSSSSLVLILATQPNAPRPGTVRASDTAAARHRESGSHETYGVPAAPRSRKSHRHQPPAPRCGELPKQQMAVGGTVPPELRSLIRQARVEGGEGSVGPGTVKRGVVPPTGAAAESRSLSFTLALSRPDPQTHCPGTVRGCRPTATPGSREADIAQGEVRKEARH